LLISKNSDENSLKILLVPIILGVISFFLTVGPLPLNPLNISWLSGWDPQQEYYGWAIYRNSPWEFPVGLNTNFGMEFGSSVVYSDAIPILAILFKLINFLLPEKFQYFGLWNLVSFIGQSIFAWMLLNLFIKDRWILVFSTCLFIFSPPFLWKIGSSNSLISQFLILAALYLLFKKKNTQNFYQWLFLLVLAEGIHFYIFSMIGVLWFVGLLQQLLIEKTLDKLQAGKQILIVLVVILTFGWQFGYFAVGAGSAATGNYGLGAMNVLAPFNSSGWSYVIPAIPQTPFNFVQSNLILNNVEGMNYLGAGSLMILLIAFVGIIKNKSFTTSWLKNYPFIFLGLLSLSLLAISNKVSIGPLNFTFQLPEEVIGIASMFRASGRMFWPVYYMIVLCSLVVVFRSFKKPVAVLMIGACALIQIFDTHAQWSSERNALQRASMETPKNILVSSFWNIAGNKYDELIRVPAKNNLYDWVLFSRYAAANKMATNSVFLARFDENKLLDLNEALDKEISNGQYRPSGLYIIEDSGIIPVLMNLDQSKHLFARIDGYNVLAPYWKSCTSCMPNERFDEYSGLMHQLSRMKSYRFSDRELDRISLALLSRGWGNPESWGVWSSSNNVQMIVPYSLGENKILTLELRALTSNKLPSQEVGISINGQPFNNYILTQGAGNIIEIKIPKQLLKKDFLVLDFHLPNAARPADLGITADDERLLAIGIVSAAWN
jgi:hypothetical protein